MHFDFGWPSSSVASHNHTQTYVLACTFASRVVVCLFFLIIDCKYIYYIFTKQIATPKTNVQTSAARVSFLNRLSVIGCVCLEGSIGKDGVKFVWLQLMAFRAFDVCGIYCNTIHILHIPNMPYPRRPPRSTGCKIWISLLESSLDVPVRVCVCWCGGMPSPTMCRVCWRRWHLRLTSLANAWSVGRRRPPLLTTRWRR